MKIPVTSQNNKDKDNNKDNVLMKETEKKKQIQTILLPIEMKVKEEASKTKKAALFLNQTVETETLNSLKKKKKSNCWLRIPVVI